MRCLALSLEFLVFSSDMKSQESSDSSVRCIIIMQFHCVATFLFKKAKDRQCIWYRHHCTDTIHTVRLSVPQLFEEIKKIKTILFQPNCSPNVSNFRLNDTASAKVANLSFSGHGVKL